MSSIWELPKKRGTVRRCASASPISRTWGWSGMIDHLSSSSWWPLPERRHSATGSTPHGEKPAPTHSIRAVQAGRRILTLRSIPAAPPGIQRHASPPEAPCKSEQSEIAPAPEPKWNVATAHHFAEQRVSKNDAAGQGVCGQMQDDRAPAGHRYQQPAAILEKTSGGRSQDDRPYQKNHRMRPARKACRQRQVR